MDKKLKAKWIKALRSGRYKQANGYLLDSDGGMCCLGVLATIQGCDLPKMREQDADLAVDDLPRGFNAGIARKERTRLACMNDGIGDFVGKPHSFKEIADYIKNYL